MKHSVLFLNELYDIKDRVYSNDEDVKEKNRNGTNREAFKCQ